MSRPLTRRRANASIDVDDGLDEIAEQVLGKGPEMRQSDGLANDLNRGHDPAYPSLELWMRQILGDRHALGRLNVRCSDG